MDSLRLAVIGTFAGRHENTFALMHRLFVDSTRKPDEAWLMCEAREDADAIEDAFDELYAMGLIEDLVPGFPTILQTPKTNGNYDVIPYANKINFALDQSEADLFVYLDNNSMPGPQKFEVLARALEENPDWGAVYCTQKRTGFAPMVMEAVDPVRDGYCVLNYTQVMHRKTDQRWTLDMRHANPDLADGLFWRQLHDQVGAFYPAGGTRIHDDHHIPSPAMAGL